MFSGVDYVSSLSLPWHNSAVSCEEQYNAKLLRQISLSFVFVFSVISIRLNLLQDSEAQCIIFFLLTVELLKEFSILYYCHVTNTCQIL